jgi:cytochrome P450
MVIWLQRPDLIQIVQAEMDTVLGGHGYGTMPVLEDMPRLPALNALVKETLRWFPVTPLAFPHVAEKDDEWKGLQVRATVLVGERSRVDKGKQIKKGTLVMVCNMMLIDEQDTKV